MSTHIHTSQICFYKRRLTFYVHERQSVMPVIVWQTLCHVRTFIKVQPIYKKSSSLKHFFCLVIIINYFKYSQLWHIKAIFKTKISMHKYKKRLKTIWKFNLYSMYTNYIKIQHLILRKSHNFLMYSTSDLILRKYTTYLKIRDIKETKPYKSL